MQISFYNSLAKQKQLFTPINDKKVGMYVCGPTVYERPHLGNARAIVVYDLLYRLLCYIYSKEHVVYVRNITDVDDKINHAAKEKNVSIQALTKQITEYFHHDIKAINCLAPNIEPKATQHITQMIDIIERLIANGHAYLANQHVYFSVDTYHQYTKLSGRSLDELIAGSRVEIAEQKRNPADFVLWKPADSEDDPSSVFDSPFGPGRPGWHIECSAMSTTYLGQDFDIHGGGVDLIFPHHTNEIAQSCCAFEKSNYAKFWIHNGFLTVAGEKMSKSLGNFFTVKEMLDQGIKGEVIRYVLLSTHYHKPLNWNEKSVNDASKALDSMYRVIHSTNSYLQDVDINEIVTDLADDLNIAEAFAKLHNWVNEFHKSNDPQHRTLLASKIKKSANFMGFLEQDPSQWLGIGEDEAINKKLAQRIQAKKDKNWTLADQIRQQLKEENIVIEDHPDGTSSWRRI